MVSTGMDLRICIWGSIIHEMSGKSYILITMGGSLKDKVRRDQLEAMKTVMVGDRIRNRAKPREEYPHL